VLITVIPISSQTQRAGLLDVLIPKNNINRLMSDSIIKTRQISSFDNRRFIKKIGVCQENILTTVLENVHVYLAKS
jgi:mRNA interferase MazF